MEGLVQGGYSYGICALYTFEVVSQPLFRQVDSSHQRACELGRRVRWVGH